MRSLNCILFLFNSLLFLYAFPFMVKICVATQPTCSDIEDLHTEANVVAYNVNDTSISLKWLPPNPPTPDLEHYEVKYYHDVADVKEIIVVPPPYCEIWMAYLCTTINDSIFLNETYAIEIQAKDRDVNNSFQYRSLCLNSSRERVSSIPRNVRYIWNKKQKLIIEWEHPDVPNGKILQFYISITQEKFFAYNVTTERLNYNYEIDVTTYNLALCVPRVIEIVAVNEIGNSSQGEYLLNRGHFLILPTIENVTDSKFDIKFPPIYNPDDDSSKLYIIVIDAEAPVKRSELHPSERKFFEEIGEKTDNSWMIGEFNLTNTTKLTVGNNLISVSVFDNDWIFFNRILDADHSYNITVLLFDSYIGSNHTFTMYAYYSLSVRTLNKDENSQSTNYQEPHTVGNIVVYAINDTSVSLRWTPPYPPTGNIEHYEILYYKYNITNVVQVDGSSKCKIWTAYICTTINDDEFSNMEIFYFQIRAKNRGVSKFGNYAPYGLRATYKTWHPSKPLNVKYNWIDEDSLNVQWEHPRVPNGQLRNFSIVLNGKITIPYNVIKESQYYNYEVDVSDYNLTKRDIVVEMYTANKIGYSQRGVSYIKSPSFVATPKIENVTDSTFDVEISPLVNTEGDTRLYIIITDTEASIKRKKNLSYHENEWYDILRLDKESSWFAGEVNPMNTTTFTVGDNSTSVAQISKTWLFFNRILDEDHSYNVTFLAVNRHKGLNLYEMFVDYMQQIKTLEAQNMNTDSQGEDFAYLWSLLLVPLLLGVVYIIIIKWRRIKQKRIKGQNMHPSSTQPEVYNIIDIYDEIELDDRIFTKVIDNQELADYIRNSIENDELRRQYLILPQRPVQSYIHGCQLPNRAKNRDPELVPYDATRVKLEVIDGDPFSDYINASYIDSYNTEKTYIATQTPTDNTYSDFWRMIWQENVKYIIIAADLNEDEKKNGNGIYWPDINDHIDLGGIRVVYKNTEVMANFEVRHFIVSCGHQERLVEQLHFFCVPDYSRVPLYIHSLASFIKKILSIPEDKSPIVVHCSNGISYTGMIILCDICLKMAISEGQVDILLQLYKLRKQRINMVNNLEQYKIVHFVLLRILESLRIPTDAGIICDKSMESVIEDILMTKIAQQMKYVEESSWQNAAMCDIDFLYDSINFAKNSETEEPQHSQDYRYWTIGDEKLFITTTIVDSFSTPSKFIVTPKPVSATLGIFWQFIFEKRINVILCLNKLSLIADFEKAFKPSPKLEVKCINRKISEYFEVYTLYANETNNKDVQIEVSIVHILDWPSDRIHPDHPNTLIMTYEEMNLLGKAGRPIVIACQNGIQASGLFVAMCFLIEKIKTEHVCDVCLAVKSIRQSRKEYIRRVEEFAFLYLCALEYVRKFKMYSNFDLSMNDE